MSCLFIVGLCSVWALISLPVWALKFLINCVGCRKLGAFDDINLVWAEEPVKAKAYPGKWSVGVKLAILFFWLQRKNFHRTVPNLSFGCLKGIFVYLFFFQIISEYVKATYVAFLVLSLFFWSSNDVNSLSDSSGKRSRSAISHKSEPWLLLRMSRIFFQQKLILWSFS